MSEGIILSTTRSVCPECLAVTPAVRIMRGDRVFLRKTCTRHGTFETEVWRGQPSYLSWNRPKTCAPPDSPATRIEEGCPRDCGLCPDHRQQTCTALIEVTHRCELSCAYCFADAGTADFPDPDLYAFRFMFERLLRAGNRCNIQLSGGEPTIRKDLPDIIALGRSLGFSFIQVNTNGVRLAGDPSYARQLRDAGLASVFLQFDGMEDSVYERIRGRRLLREKKRAVEHCGENGLGVVLVPTLIPGANVGQIGKIIEYAVENIGVVRGVHFQPVSYFGRYPGPPRAEDRITIPEIIREIAAQTSGKMAIEHFKPPGCENAYCSFNGSFVLLPDGSLKSRATQRTGSCCPEMECAEEGAARARRFVARFWSAPESLSSVPAVGPGLGEWEAFLERVKSHSLSISGMAFQDAWNLDLERLRDCCIHVATRDGRLVPFCAYNLTDAGGKSIHREWTRRPQSDDDVRPSPAEPHS